MDRFEMKRLAMQFWRRDLAVALKFPGKDVGEVFIISQSFAFRGLMFFAEMRAAGFVASEGVEAHQLGEFQEVGEFF